MANILILERSSYGRDHEVISLLYYYLRQEFSVSIKSIFEAEIHIQVQRPKLIILMNPYGSLFHFEVLKNIKRYGIPIVTIIAEGNFPNYSFQKIFWGWNYHKEIIEDIFLIWSKKSKQIISENNIGLIDKVKVTGAIGFDRYRIYDYLRNEHIIKQLPKRYKNIIGLAGWAFDGCYNNSPLYESMLKKYGKNQCISFTSDGIKLNNIYKELIEYNKEILFILKIHPAIYDHKKGEFYNKNNLSKYENSLVVKNELSISDCIGLCDLWIGFETTTCLEAWLLNKTTMYINPSGTEFLRTKYYMGNPIVRSFEEAQECIESVIKKGKFSSFEEKKTKREKILQEEIQWADGKNHMRAGYIIKKIYRNFENKKYKYVKKIKIKQLILSIFYILSRYRIFNWSPLVRNLKEYSIIFNTKELRKYNDSHYKKWKNFYLKNKLTKNEIRELIEINNE